MKNIKEKMYLFSFISVMTLNLVACDANKNEATVSKKFAAKNINEIHVKTIGQDIKVHSTSKSLLCRRKSNLHLFARSVFTSQVAEKGPDRFYAWPDSFSHLKRGFFMSFF